MVLILIIKHHHGPQDLQKGGPKKNEFCEPTQWLTDLIGSEG
jgi:hypothetical protein